MSNLINPSPIKSFILGETYYTYKNDRLIEFEMIEATPKFIRFIDSSNNQLQTNKKFVFKEKAKLEHLIIKLKAQKIKDFNGVSARTIQKKFEEFNDSFEILEISIGDFVFYSEQKDIREILFTKCQTPFNIFNGIVESETNNFYNIQTMDGNKIRKSKKYVSADVNEVEFNEWTTRKNSLEKYLGMPITKFYKLADDIVSNNIEQFV